jgi:hypothetical protein
MTSSALIQFLIFVEVFAMGVLSAVAVRHAYAHFRPEKIEAKDHPAKPPAVNYVMPPATRQQLEQTARTQFETVVKHSVIKFQNDLGVSSEQINNLVRHLATEIVGAEMERYRLQLSQLHQRADVDMNGIRTEVAKHETELKAKLAAEIVAEKQQLIKQIDTKLADAVASFLLETLKHNIDLGSQGAYLTALLEEHKADFIKEVADETQPAG